MATANLNVILTAQTARFEAGMHRVGRQLNTFRASVVGIGAAVSGALAFRGAFGALKGAADSADNLIELSKRLGESANNMATLEVAAAHSNQTLDNMASHLVRMNRAIGQGSPALEKLGLSAEQLAGRSPVEAFMEIGQAIAALPTQAERTAAAMQIFGRTGASLLPLFDKGPAAFAEMADKAQRFGLAVGKDGFAALEAMDEKVTDLQKAWDGLIRQLLIGLTPAIENVVERLSAAAEISHSFADGLRIAAAVATDAWSGLEAIVASGLSVIALHWEKMLEVIVAAGEALEPVLGKLQEVEDAKRLEGLAEAVRKDLQGRASSRFNDLLAGGATGRLLKQLEEERRRGRVQSDGRPAPYPEELAAQGALMQLETQRRELPRAGALEKGSVEAFSAIVGREQIQQRMLKVIEKQLDAEQRQLRALEAMENDEDLVAVIPPH